MGSMALQLKPFTVADPFETYSRAVSLRNMMDQRRYNELRRAELEQKIVEGQEERQQTQNLRQLFSTNPNPTMQDILSVAPGSAGIRAATEFRQAQAAEETRKTAELTRQKNFLDVQQNFRVQYLNAITAIARDKDPARRAELYPKLQQSLRTAAAEYLDPDLDAFISQPIPDDEDEILNVYAAVYGPDKLEELLKNRAAETRAKAEEERKVAGEARAVAKEEREIAAEGRPTGTLREFKESYYPGWLEEKGLQPSAVNEKNALEDWRKLIREYVGGRPGVDVVTPQPVIDQEIAAAIAKAKAIAEATAGTKPATEGERKVLGYYDMMQHATQVLERPRTDAAGKTLPSLEQLVQNLSRLEQQRLKFAPNDLQTEEGQQYNQALRQFTAARLRKESGAAISQSEIEESIKTYFPWPGDKEPVLKQKRDARQALMNSLKGEAGQAWKLRQQETAPTPPSGGRYAPGSDPMKLGVK